MGIRIIENGTMPHKNLEIVAEMLTRSSVHKRKYTVENVYFDYGANMMWTTICCKSDWGGVQILNPFEWELIVDSVTLDDLSKAVKSVKSGRYFND